MGDISDQLDLEMEGEEEAESSPRSLTVQLCFAALCSEPGLELRCCHTLAQAFSLGFPGVKLISQELILHESHPERKQKEAKPEPGQPRHTDSAQTHQAAYTQPALRHGGKKREAQGALNTFQKLKGKLLLKFCMGINCSKQYPQGWKFLSGRRQGHCRVVGVSSACFDFPHS